MLNPFWSLHARLTGGWRSNAAIALVFAALVVGVSIISYRLAGPAGAGEVTRVWLMIVTSAQGAFLLLIGPGAVRRAVLRDFQSGMMESHRLSPMSNAKIIAGYLTGAPVQAALLYAVSLVLGSYFAAVYGQLLSVAPAVVLGTWYALQPCLLLLSFMITSLVLLVAVTTAGKTNIVGLVVMVCAIGGWILFRVIPGLGLVVGLFTADVMVGLLTRSTPRLNENVVGLTALAQAALGATFVVAACRKVRAPERAMFTIPLGLVLAAIWGTSLVIGIHVLPPDHWLVLGFSDLGAVQIGASTVAFMAVGLVTLVAAAVERFHLDRRAAFGVAIPAWEKRLADAVPILLGGLTMLLAVLMYSVLGDELRTDDLDNAFAGRATRAAMLLAVLLANWTLFQWAYTVIARGWRLFRLLLFAVIVLMVAPIGLAALVGGIKEAVDGQLWQVGDSYFAGISPVGTLLLCLSGHGNVWPGLVAQGVLAMLATLVARRARRSLQATRNAPVHAE